MKYAIRTILAAATVAAAYYFTPSAPGKDIQAVELEQQYEQADYDFMRGDAEIPREYVYTALTQIRKGDF